MFIAKPLANPVVVTRPDGNDIPLLLDSPHSGTFYPADYNSHQPFNVMRRGEDTYVDDLFKPAVKHGATFIEALFPRTYVDVNRHVHDIDPQFITDEWTEPVELSEKGKLGKGMIWTAVKGDSSERLYNRQFTAAEVYHRINHYYKPYRKALQAEHDRLMDKFGMVYHINCHSMSSVADNTLLTENVGDIRPEFMIGDGSGERSDTEFTNVVVESFRRHAKPNQKVTLNDPFNGCELTNIYGKPKQHSHSLLIELSRALILDPENMQIFDHYSETKQQLKNVVADIAEYVRQKL